DHDQVWLQRAELLLDRIMQPFLVIGGYREGFPGHERRERTQPTPQSGDGNGGHPLHIVAETRKVIEGPATISEAEYMHLVCHRKMADLVKGGDLVSAVRREWDALAHKENSHRSARRLIPAEIKARPSAPPSSPYRSADRSPGSSRDRVG